MFWVSFLGTFIRIVEFSWRCVTNIFDILLVWNRNKKKKTWTRNTHASQSFLFLNNEKKNLFSPAIQVATTEGEYQKLNFIKKKFELDSSFWHWQINCEFKTIYMNLSIFIEVQNYFTMFSFSWFLFIFFSSDSKWNISIERKRNVKK